MEKPKISIIGGTGKEGMGLGIRWAAAGYEILIGSRQVEKAKLAAEEINQQLNTKTVIGLENSEAIKKADICVLTVIQSAHSQILERLHDNLQGKILVDATARVDFREPHPPDPPSAAEQAQAVLGSNVRIVAAFQNVPAKVLAMSFDRPIKSDVLVCSDDIDAAEQVIQLVNAAGMRGYYAGILANANVVEGLTAILISMNKYYGIKDARIMVSGI